MAEVQALGGAFGVEVRGVDLSRGVDAASMRLLTQVLYDNQVIAIRDQSLSKQRFLQFGRQWGEPIPHVLDHIRMRDYPEMMVVGNVEDKDKKDDIRNGAALWHTDQSYEKVPASATMLYSIKVPCVGGETQFCNMTAAYEDLDETIKGRIDSLQVAHKYGKGKRRSGEKAVNPIINDEQDRRVPPIYHPMVLAHPITGRKALYALGHGAHGIQAMDNAEAEDLIETLKDHILQEKYIYRHRYAVGDLVIWDTLQTLHCATPIDLPNDATQERELWRISVRGRPNIYRNIGQ